jgi:hypothetical protein
VVLERDLVLLGQVLQSGSVLGLELACRSTLEVDDSATLSLPLPVVTAGVELMIALFGAAPGSVALLFSQTTTPTSAMSTATTAAVIPMANPLVLPLAAAMCVSPSSGSVPWIRSAVSSHCAVSSL